MNLKHMAIAIAALGLTLPAVAARAKTENDRLPVWTRLEFKASKLFVTARSTIEIELEDAATAASGWASIQPQHRPPEQVVRLRSTASFLGRTATTDVWLDPADLRAYQRHAVDSGSRHRHKTYRFGPKHVRTLRSEPETKDEEGLPEAEWTRRSEGRIELDDNLLVTDPLAVFYLLARRPTAPQEVQIVSSNELGTVRIERAERGQVETSADVLRTDGSAVAGEMASRPAIRYTVTPAEGDSDFSLLGLEGAISVWIDEEFGVPLEVRGRISPVGSVRVKLERALLRAFE